MIYSLINLRFKQIQNQRQKMMDHNNVVECEEVKIGDWSTRLPSDVCSNREIFSKIFSIDTWNNVLNPEQQQRIMKMLPAEVSSNPEDARQTIEELLSGTLTVFSRNPINNFYDHLEQGHYDPEVIEAKSNIKREWRKESLRQLKSYHTKLLEDIVISRQRHLNRIKFKSAIRSKYNQKPSKQKKPPVPLLGTPTLGNNAPVKVAVLANNTNSNKAPKSPAVSPKKRKIKEESAEVMENGPPDAKKPLKSKVSVEKKITNDINKSPQNSNHSESTMITIAPKVTTESIVLSSSATVPAPTAVVSETKLSLPSTITSPIVQQLSQTVTLKQDVSVPDVTTDGSRLVMGSTITTNSPSQPVLQTISSTSNTINQDFHQALKTSTSFLSNPSKSSPILASQLQASPQVSVKIEDNLKQFQESDSCRITLNYQKAEEKSSEDDLETSSDEFEAIEPTIGFGTTVHSSPEQTVMQPIKVEPVEPPLKTPNVKLTLPVSFQRGFGTKQTQITQENAYLTTSKSMTYSSPILIVNTKRNTAQASLGTPSTEIQQNQLFQLQCKGSVVTQKAPVTQLDLSLINASNSVSKNQMPISSVACIDSANKLTTSAAGFLLKEGLTSSLQQRSLASVLTSEASRIISTSNEHPGKAFRISGGELCGRTITLSVPVSSIQSQSTNYSIPTPNKALNFQATPMTSTPKAPVHLSVMAPSSMCQNLSNVQFVSGQLTEGNLCSNEVNTSSSLLDNEDLNLNLGSLGIGLGMNINLGLESMVDNMSDSDTAMKLEMDVIDKIDDLSVLDGNPFDSIPNLSDELDGLDLDLVDGLCDFEGLLSDEKKYPSFFSLIRDVLCSTRDHRMNLMCLEKTVRKWSTSPGATMNSWFLRVADWNNTLVTALNFLAGNYQVWTKTFGYVLDVHPEDFVPYIEYKYKTKYYQWIGAGRDGDNNLTPLCSIWMDNLDRLPSIKKLDGETEDQEEDDDENEDSELTGEEAKKKNKRPLTPPPPRCITDWSVRASTVDEKNVFRKQERSRFENPHKAFTYKMHGYESVVGPVKGVYSSQVGMTNKARGHSLLVDDRPPYVTILALVRDAVARLPNGEGTRSEICEMLRDSAFLAPDASSVTLNSVVSGALDRLHYERDPCVRYDSHKKSWIYLHRDRTQEQFERLHHNRSYTKSTKCRNNTARKSRKGATKGQSNTSTGSASIPSTSPSGISLLNTTTSSSDLGTSEDKVDTVLPLNTPVTATTSIASTQLLTFQGGIKQEPGTSSSISTSKNLSSIDVLKKETNQVQISANAPTVVPIRLTALPESTNPTHLNQDKSAPTSSSIRPQFILQTTNSSIGQVSSNSPIQIRTTRPIQIQNLATTTSTTVSLENLTNAVSTSNNPTTNTLAQGQYIVNPTMLRVANALRYAVRLPGTAGNMNNTNVRLPQHRILLTRSMVPGQPQTQGVLLGQTASGQTVILSTSPAGTLGGFQALNSIQAGQFNDLSLRALHTSNALTSITTSASTVSQPQIVTLSYTSSNSSNTMTATSISQANIIQTSTSGTSILQSAAGTSSTSTKSVVFGSKPATTSVPSVALNPPSSSANQNQHHQSITIAGGGIKISNPPAQLVPSSTSVPLPTIPTIHIQTVAPNNLSQSQTMVSDTQQQNSENMASNNQNQTPLTSPIIIRSQQGEFLIPGHISLTRGMQGIKLIPLQMGNMGNMGNKTPTVLAKFVPQGLRMTDSVTGTIASSSTTTSTTTQPQQGQQQNP